jgi:uncharacterized membrane-anchored protein
MLEKIAAAFACAFLLGLAQAQAEEPAALTAEEKAYVEKMTALQNSLRPVRGEVTLPAASARLSLGSKYYMLGAEDARKVLVEGWGNPPSAAEGVLGLVFPEGKGFLDQDSWGAVITYEKTDYVSDEDAQTADYDGLLKQMQTGEDGANAERQKAGYDPVRLIGWAQPPSYDAARHDLIWARELKFGEQQDHSLNYDVRHLGRRGVLSLNIVSNMSQLSQVRGAAQELAKTAEFEPGSRYADYRKGDKRAGYGLAGLVAAGAGLAVAKKLGFLAIAMIFLKKGAVVLLAGAAGGFAWLRKRFARQQA